MHTRRMILRGGTAAVLAGIASPALAGLTSPALVGLKDTGAKALSFDNLHTGEKLSVDYWIDGQYVPQALQSINVVLRDFRNGEVHAIDPKLLDLLNLLHRELDSSVPFSIISGYRSPATNAQLHERSSGVAVKSLHMQGMAADIRLGDRDLSVLHRTAVKMQVGGVGYYPSSDFVHVDVGHVRYWGAKDPSLA